MGLCFPSTAEGMTCKDCSMGCLSSPRALRDSGDPGLWTSRGIGVSGDSWSNSQELESFRRALGDCEGLAALRGSALAGESRASRTLDVSLRTMPAFCRALLGGSEPYSGWSIHVGLGLAQAGLAPFQSLIPMLLPGPRAQKRTVSSKPSLSALKFKCRMPLGSSLLHC